MYKRYYPTIITLGSVAVVLASLAVLWRVLSFSVREQGWGVAAGISAILAISALNVLRKRRQLRTKPLPASSALMLEELERQAPFLLVPHRQQYLASGRAFIHAAYGEFETAHAQLASVPWEDLPESLSITYYHTRAALAFLSNDDLTRGLADARRAERLAAENKQLILGKDTVKRLHRFYVSWGEALCGDAGSVDVSDFEVLRGHIGPLVRALATAAYARLLHERGDAQRSAAVRAELLAMAPHARGLLRHATAVARANAVEGSSHTPAGLTNVASCANHPGTATAGTCHRCGAFACLACASNGEQSRRYCPACVERLGAQARDLLKLEARIRGLATFPIALGALLLLALLVGLARAIYTASWPSASHLGGAAYMTIIGLVSLSSGLRLHRRKRPSVLSKLPWVVSLALIPFGTLLGVYALTTLRRERIRPLYSEEYADSVTIAGLKPGISAPFVVLSLLAVAPAVAYVVLGFLGAM